MNTLLMVAPACDGEDVGESWLAFQWASLLSTRFDLTLLTTYKRGHTPASEQLPGVRVIEWGEPPFVWRYERINSLLQPAYLPFYVRARRWIKSRLAAGEHFEIAHQPVPVAMRYPSPAAGLGIPLIIGPVGGSLQSPAGFVAEEGGTPWYQRLRRLDSLRLRHDPLLRRSFESADCVLGIAPYVGDLLGDLAIRRFETLSDVALHDVRPVTDRSARTGPVRLLYVGRIIRTKGLLDVIRALDQLRDLPVILDVVGEGADRSACEDTARELGLAERVVFHGAVSRTAVNAFYERADIFVFPSYREPGGSVVLEAMAAGLPVIVVDRGGPGANVDTSCAVRLPAVSPDQLAADCSAAVRALVGNPDLRIRMGMAARVHVQKNHLWLHRLDRMSAIYDQVSSPARRT